VTKRKSDIERNYAPDFVSRETLAYRLDCSPGLIDDYVTKGLLPRPLSIGNLVRWRWVDVEGFILAESKPSHGELGPNACRDDDPFLRRLSGGKAAHA